MLIVNAAYKFLLFGAFNSIRRIARQKPRLKRILQGLSDVGMAVDHRIGRHSIYLHFVSVVVLQLLRRNLPQPKPWMVFLKIRDNPILDTG